MVHLYPLSGYSKVLYIYILNHTDYHLCRGIRPPNECPGCRTKQSAGEATVMLELWGMQSTPSLPLQPGSLCPGVVAPDRVRSMDQIELFDI